MNTPPQPGLFEQTSLLDFVADTPDPPMLPRMARPVRKDPWAGVKMPPWGPTKLRIFAVMKSGAWMTKKTIHDLSGVGEHIVSARLSEFPEEWLQKQFIDLECMYRIVPPTPTHD